MPTLIAASVAILHHHRILLIQREDFYVWGLPGGDVDPGESLAQAAIREAQEETGLMVELSHLVGMYALVDQGHTLITGVFAARPVSGDLHPDPHEIRDAQWFSSEHLPTDLMWWDRQRIADALAGIRGAIWRQEGGWPFPPGFTRRDLYAIRDHSPLPRAQVFRQLFPYPGRDAEICEVPGVSLPPLDQETKKGGS